jgi:hypothetical protein
MRPAYALRALVGNWPGGGGRRPAPVEVNPSSAVFHEQLAFASVQGRDWATALREARAALEIDPFLRFSRMFLIQAPLHRGEAGPARDEFATLIGLYPDLREPLER